MTAVRQTIESASHPDALLKMATVEALTGLCRSYVYVLIKKAKFPAPVKLAPRCSRWRAGDVMAYLQSLQPETSK